MDGNSEPLPAVTNSRSNGTLNRRVTVHQCKIAGKEQVCLVLEGQLTLHSEYDILVTFQKSDSAWLEPWESHSVENTGDRQPIRLDVFTPGHAFGFWTDRKVDE